MSSRMSRRTSVQVQGSNSSRGRGGVGPHRSTGRFQTATGEPLSSRKLLERKIDSEKKVCVRLEGPAVSGVAAPHSAAQ